MIPPIAFHPAYEAPLPSGHRFPMRKYGLLAETLVAKGLAPLGFVTPEPASAEILLRAHDSAYVDAVLACDVGRDIERAIGLPVDAALVRRSRASVGGTLLAGRLALAEGLAGSAAGGSHHARRRQGAGFCVLNDVAVAARTLQAEGLVRRVLVVDLDVHQGDGTADCLALSPDLFTLSIHCENNYPAQKIAGDLDIGLPDRLDDAAYLDVLRARLPPLLDAFAPDLVFYNAGVDPHRDDRLGRLCLTDDGLLARDRYVVAQARARGIALAAVIGGGYTHDVEALARRHALVFEALAAEAAAGSTLA
ncbi:Acetoin utilization deacetylase AcuC [Methylobacterium sp. UNC300MFChir4.1]|uniref:histone deacetylase family protein n=1 Tax=Methylobacterium sp. UNC300MFChir4.1 TaxID=1502747 RepID=UPI0008ACF6D9|nr:histone deacetylase [Methylobacterium sp. UNC300MFChir4.1]SEN12522.1 Acetoin utilization deacetylase AcuC [Methylobacterium sp. UNC300MFChir4.1]